MAKQYGTSKRAKEALITHTIQKQKTRFDRTEGHTMVGIEQKRNADNEIEVAGLRCRERNGNYKYIKERYILACGGIATPAILLSQKLCNSSGLIERI